MADNTTLHRIIHKLFVFPSHGRRLVFSVTVTDYSAVQQLKGVCGGGGVLGWPRKHKRHDTEGGRGQASTAERERELARLL